MAEIERWITINGSHVPIMKGESKIAAVAKFIKSKRAAKQGQGKTKNSDKLLQETNKIWDKANKEAEEYAKANGYRGDYYGFFRKAEADMAKVKEKYEQPDDPYIPVGASVSYNPKRDYLDETRKGDGYRWTGKEYTNDEFLEHLEDANWHTEHRMLVNAGLTNRQMEYIKNNTKLDIYTADLDRAKTEKLIKEAKEKFPAPAGEKKLITGARMTKQGRADARDRAIEDFNKKDREAFNQTEAKMARYKDNDVMRHNAMEQYALQYNKDSGALKEKLTSLADRKTNPTGKYKLNAPIENAKRTIKGIDKDSLKNAKIAGIEKNFYESLVAQNPSLKDEKFEKEWAAAKGGKQYKDLKSNALHLARIQATTKPDPKITKALENGQTVKIGGKGNYDPANFKIENGKVYVQSKILAGMNTWTEHPTLKNATDVSKHITNLQKNGFPINYEKGSRRNITGFKSPEPLKNRQFDGEIQLQHVGKVDAVKASNLKPGDITMWNGGATEKILSISPKGKQSLSIEIQSSNGGNKYTRTMRRDRLVGLANSEAKNYAAEFGNSVSRGKITRPNTYKDKTGAMQSEPLFSKRPSPSESQVADAIKKIGNSGKTKVGNLEIRSYGDDKYGVQFYSVKTPGGNGVDFSTKNSLMRFLKDGNYIKASNKASTSNSKTVKNAYERYMKEHPNSKMKLTEFKSTYKD